MGRESTDVTPQTLMVKVFNFKENKKSLFDEIALEYPIWKFFCGNIHDNLYKPYF